MRPRWILRVITHHFHAKIKAQSRYQAANGSESQNPQCFALQFRPTIVLFPSRGPFLQLATGIERIDEVHPNNVALM